MKVNVKLFATLVQSVSEAVLADHPQGIRSGIPLEVELPDRSSLTDLVTYLGLPEKEVKVVFVNGRARGLDYRLAPGDDVGIFPPVGGG